MLRYPNKRGVEVEVWGYLNYRHSGDRETSRGQCGYVFVGVGAAISWRTSMMKCVTHNSNEYVGLSEVGN